MLAISRADRVWQQGPSLPWLSFCRSLWCCTHVVRAPFGASGGSTIQIAECLLKAGRNNWLFFFACMEFPWMFKGSYHVYRYECIRCMKSYTVSCHADTPLIRSMSFRVIAPLSRQVSLHVMADVLWSATCLSIPLLSVAVPCLTLPLGTTYTWPNQCDRKQCTYSQYHRI